MKHTVFPWDFAGFKTCLDEHCNDYGPGQSGFVWRQCRRTGVKVHIGYGDNADEASKWHVMLCGRLEPIDEPPRSAEVFDARRS